MDPRVKPEDDEPWVKSKDVERALLQIQVGHQRPDFAFVILGLYGFALVILGLDPRIHAVKSQNESGFKEDQRSGLAR